MQSQIEDRNTHKTSEGEFVYELEHLYELSPKMSESIVESAKRCLIRDNILKEGQLEVSVISLEERSGKFIENMKKCRVILTVDNGIEDRYTRQEFGRIKLRQIRISRITEEAIEQGGILSQEDIGRILVCTVRTIQRDIHELKSRDMEVITRGVLHNIGRCQTHKVKIIGLYLEGKTFSEIKLQTHHSVGSIKRYLQGFQKVMMSIHHGIKDVKSITNVTGISHTVVNQYIELINQSKKDPQKKSKIKDMIRQWERAGTRIKKKGVTSRDYIRSLAPMTGGVR